MITTSWKDKAKSEEKKKKKDDKPPKKKKKIEEVRAAAAAEAEDEIPSVALPEAWGEEEGDAEEEKDEE